MNRVWLITGASSGFGRAITEADAPETPLRLPLGDDAVDAISSHLNSVRAELTTWEKVARDTRLDALA